MTNANALTQEFTSDSNQPMKYGKLPQKGKVNLCIQAKKYAIDNATNQSFTDMGAATDLDVARPIFYFENIDAKLARKIIIKNRDNLLCQLILTTDPYVEKPEDARNMQSLYQRAPTMMAWRFFTQWASTCKMYKKNVVKH